MTLEMDETEKHENLSKIDILAAYANYLMHYIRSFMRYKRQYRNYLSVVYNVTKNRYPIYAILRDGNKKKFFSQNEIWLDLANLSYSHDGNVVYVDDIILLGGTTDGDIFNIFHNKDYRSLPLRDKVVIDIGANIADSSIYFASQGARKVFGVEPNYNLYRLARQNVVLSKFSSQVEIIWAACSSESLEGSTPPFVSLDALIRKFNILPHILKMDCEGCEYDVILNCSDEFIQRFEHILIEYHYGYKNLKQKLERSGFDVDISLPRYHKRNKVVASQLDIRISKNTSEADKRSYVGWIYARRISSPATRMTLR
jgi:hypothetical protein